MKITGYEKGTGKKLVIADNVNPEVALKEVIENPFYTDPVTGTVYTTYTEQ